MTREGATVEVGCFTPEETRALVRACDFLLELTASAGLNDSPVLKECRGVLTAAAERAGITLDNHVH